MEQNAFEHLDVTETSLPAEIRSSYYRKAQMYHPDHGGKAEEFLSIKKAFDFLMNPKLRDSMGHIRMFKRLRIRLQPSLNRGLQQLIENLESVEKRQAI